MYLLRTIQFLAEHSGACDVVDQLRGALLVHLCCATESEFRLATKAFVPCSGADHCDVAVIGADEGMEVVEGEFHEPTPRSPGLRATNQHGGAVHCEIER
jgi:hypothetical protein